MIKVTRINKVEVFWINENLIEYIEETPDTILSLNNGKKVAVAETAEQVIALIDERKRLQNADPALVESEPAVEPQPHAGGEPEAPG